MPRKKYLQERAAVLNKKSASSGAPFVLASSTPELKHVHIAGFMCKACGTEFAAKDGTEPFCINCGSEKVESKAVTVASLPETDKALSAVTCKSCGTHNVLADVTASTLQGHMHCVECGTSLTFDTDGLERPISDADSADIDKAVQAAGPDDKRGGMTDDAPISDADATSIEQTLPTTEATATPAATETADQADQVGIDPMDNQAVVQDLNDDELIEQQQMATPEDGVQAFVKASLVALVLAQNAAPKFEIASTDDCILAFADGLPVARLYKEKAGEHAEVFHSQAFQRSILQVAAKDGVKAALAAYPFEAITVNFPQAGAIRAMVERKAVEASATYQEQAEAYSSEFMQCISLAATGLTKGFFRKYDNSLKAGFVNTLTTAGVQGAKKMVDQVFAANADAYHKTLFTVAADLMKKPVDVRNEFAEMMGETNAIVDGEEVLNPEHEDVSIDVASLSARMENSAVRSARKSQAVAKAEVASVTSISDIRQQAGGKLF